VGMGFKREMVVKGIEEIGNSKTNEFISFFIRVCNFCFSQVFCFQVTMIQMHCLSYFSHIRYLYMCLCCFIYPIILLLHGGKDCT
jgi:hypothetical protein